MRSGNVRLLLVLDLAAAAAAVLALIAVVVLPLAAGGGLTRSRLALLALAGAAGFVTVAALLLFRAVAGPVDRMLSAAERLGAGEGGLPLLHPPGEERGPGLSRAAVAFERLAAALGEERGRLAAKVAELERANRDLADARESLLRSERLATVGRLASGIAHEVGNPLGAIAGYADLARNRLSAGRTADVGDALERIAAEVQRIDAIVRDLLDFARPAPPALAPVDLGPTVDAAVRLARVQGRFRDVEVRRVLPEGVPCVLADERRLSQLLLNLLLNAGDAMGGQGRVEISARTLPGAPERVEIAVEDTGPGIAPEHLGRVFDPFFTTKPPGRGTGLGLAVCHGIAASFGGEISAGAGAAGGAVFRLVLRAC